MLNQCFLKIFKKCSSFIFFLYTLRLKVYDSIMNPGSSHIKNTTIPYFSTLSASSTCAYVPPSSESTPKNTSKLAKIDYFLLHVISPLKSLNQPSKPLQVAPLIDAGLQMILLQKRGIAKIMLV